LFVVAGAKSEALTAYAVVFPVIFGIVDIDMVAGCRAAC
jgi:hypothetical protein